MKKIKVFTISLGCPKNRVDTERMLGALGSDMVPAERTEEADLILINTCGFIRPAVEESVQAILDAAEEISGLPQKPLLAVTGCMVSRYGELNEDLPEVDLWLTTDRVDLWPEIISKALGRDFNAATYRRISTGPSYAYLKISEGCSHSCSFCTIPSIRGPHISRPIPALVEEAKTIVAGGIPELVLVGQDSTAYGCDLDDGTAIRPLIEELMKIDRLEWMRLMYLYPAGLTDSFLSFMAGAGRPLLPYFDIPLQHAHPEILSSMGRPFAHNPRKVIERVRKHIPEAVLRTTIIVGYPGETEEHFKTLMDFVEETRFHHLGVFAYQAEEGTPAAELEQLPDEIKEERREAVMALQSDISHELMEENIGRKVQVLVEKPHDEWDGLFTGRVWFQAPEVDGITYVSSPEDGPELSPGMIVEAEVDDCTDYDLITLV
ncbi:30S ribosomal protein S12 methylthiotransferase RimO [Maridesulfovibrio bastinii]|uniref:30S ribosomal protein S12 methylthiotransferase RimO n=1 Tax=Maridesulfovibrio bastinii TaxID=47157 RepID=UPI0003F6F6A8|nr:30S ribosomal protein S12 methylthiotransferase RimO [Maridesulfovibrio bastinii]